MELIAIVVCVILVAVLGLRAFGGQISNTTNETTNTVETLTSTVLNGSGGPGGSGDDNPTPGIDMTNINVMDGTTTLAAGDFSTKGNLVTINDTQYRVLAVDGTMAKVMSMKSVCNSKFNSSDVSTSFDGKAGLKYAGSNIDNAMTFYYNSLPSAIQDAIIEQNINQSAYTITSGTNTSANFSSGSNYYLIRRADVNVGARKVYALDLDEVIEYLGPTSTPQDINEMFFGVRNSVSREVWLRSAAPGGYYNYAFRVNGDRGELSFNTYKGNHEVRLAFILDLSLLTQ